MCACVHIHSHTLARSFHCTRTKARVHTNTTQVSQELLVPASKPANSEKRWDLKRLRVFILAGKLAPFLPSSEDGHITEEQRLVTPQLQRLLKRKQPQHKNLSAQVRERRSTVCVWGSGGKLRAHTDLLTLHAHIENAPAHVSRMSKATHTRCSYARTMHVSHSPCNHSHPCSVHCTGSGTAL